MHMISTFCGTCGVATQAGSNFSQHLKSASHMKKLATPNRSTFTVNQSKTIADGRDLGAESGTNAKNTSSSIEGSMNAKSVPRLKIKNKNYSAELNVKSTVTSPGRMKNYCGSPNWKVQKNCSSTNNKALAKSKLKKINGGKTNKAPIVLKKKSAKGQANGKTVKLLKEKNSNSKTPLTSDIESKKLRENGMRTKKVWYCNVCDHSYSRKREHLETIKHKLAVEEASKQGRAEKLAEKLAQTNVGSNNATSIKVVEQIEMSAPLSTVVSEPVQECVMPGLPCRAVSAGPNTMPGVECAHFPGPDMTTYNHGIHGSISQRNFGISRIAEWELQMSAMSSHGTSNATGGTGFWFDISDRGEFKLSPTFLFKNVACRSDGLTDARPLKEERVENGNESPLSGENSETWNNQQYPYQDADAGGEQSTNVTVNSSETDDNIYIYENLNTVRNASISDYSSVADLNETGSMIKYSTDLTLDPSLESERPVPVPDEDDNLEFMQSVMSSRAVTVVTLPSNVNSNA